MDNGPEPGAGAAAADGAAGAGAAAADGAAGAGGGGAAADGAPTGSPARDTRAAPSNVANMTATVTAGSHRCIVASLTRGLRPPLVTLLSGTRAHAGSLATLESSRVESSRVAGSAAPPHIPSSRGSKVATNFAAPGRVSPSPPREHPSSSPKRGPPAGEASPDDRVTDAHTSPRLNSQRLHQARPPPDGGRDAAHARDLVATFDPRLLGMCG
jgi:hypothetical protein